MKLFIISACLFLLISQSALAQQWEDLVDDDYQDNPLPLTLRDLGIKYIQQKGMFESTKAHFPGKEYDVHTDYPQRTERRNASDVTYYRYTLTLEEPIRMDGRGQSLVNTTFTVSYRESNGNFLITSYRFNLDSDGNIPLDNEEEEGVIDFDGTLKKYLDIRPFNNGSSNFTDLLNEAKESIVAQAIQNGDLPNSDYTIRFVYEAYAYYIDIEDVYERTLNCKVKLVNSEGDYYLVHIEADYDYRGEDAEEEEEEEDDDDEPFRYKIYLPVSATTDE